MKFDLFNIVVIIFMVYVIYRLPSVEKMSNIDKATEDKIREIYKIDTDAIRNLSNLARDLTVNGKLNVPGGLQIDGNIQTIGTIISGDAIRITKKGHDIGTNNYSMEIFTPDDTNIKETSIRFHQGNKYWRQIRCDNTGFRLTDGNSGNLTTLHVGQLNTSNINTTTNVHTRDLKVNATADINNLKVNASADINNLTVKNNVNLNLGLHLIKVKSPDNAYKLITNNSGGNYNGDNWILIIAGFNIDWNNRDPGAMKLYCYLHNNNLWHIRSEIESAGDDSDVNILCIPRKYFNRVDHTGLLGSGAGF